MEIYRVGIWEREQELTKLNERSDVLESELEILQGLVLNIKNTFGTGHKVCCWLREPPWNIRGVVTDIKYTDRILYTVSNEDGIWTDIEAGDICSH